MNFEKSLHNKHTKPVFFRETFFFCLHSQKLTLVAISPQINFHRQIFAVAREKPDCKPHCIQRTWKTGGHASIRTALNTGRRKPRKFGLKQKRVGVDRMDGAPWVKGREKGGRLRRISLRRCRPKPRDSRCRFPFAVPASHLFRAVRPFLAEYIGCRIFG